MRGRHPVIAQRYCPLCDDHVQAPVCPEHGVPTVDPAVFDAPHVDDLEGQLFANKYRIHETIGRGGMGRVYRATERAMNREVALKTLLASRLTERHHVRRFYAEARAASALSSPHVVRIYDFGVDERRRVPFIAMELLRGRTLRATISHSDALPVAQAVTVGTQIARALTDAERAGIVHRDLKPANILLVDDPVGGPDFVKVMDFGIAKILDDEASLTETGTALGTLAYMAPEQILGGTVDTRTDLYALGCVLQAMLTGSPPFDPAERARLIDLHLHATPPPLPSVDVGGTPLPESLRQLVASMLSKVPDRRPPRARSVARVLDLLVRDEDDSDEQATALLVSLARRAPEAAPAVQRAVRSEQLQALTGTMELLDDASGISATPGTTADSSERVVRSRGTAGFVAAAAVVAIGAGLAAWSWGTSPAPDGERGVAVAAPRTLNTTNQEPGPDIAGMAMDALPLATDLPRGEPGPDVPGRAVTEATARDAPGGGGGAADDAGADGPSDAAVETAQPRDAPPSGRQQHLQTKKKKKKKKKKRKRKKKKKASEEIKQPAPPKRKRKPLVMW